jgi:hypothetical protein
MRVVPLGPALLIVISSCGKPRIEVGVDPNTVEAVKEAAARLESGLRGIDPVGTKDLLAQNSELRKQLEAVTRKYSEAISGPGLIVPASARLQLDVREWTGGLRIDAWIDDPANWVWSASPMPHRDIDANVGPDCPNFLDGRFRGDKPFDQVAGWLAGCRDGWRNAVTTALRNQPTPVGGGPTVRDLAAQLGSAGLHRIFIRVTPIAANNAGYWSATIDLNIDPGGGVPRQSLKSATVDSRVANQGARLGSPLPDIVMLVEVR